MLNVIALQRLEEQRLPAQGMEQKRAQVGFLIGAGGNPKQIGNVQIRAAGIPVEGFANRTQTNIRSKNCDCAGGGRSIHSITRQRSDRR